jgi:hypothetical protein
MTTPSQATIGFRRSDAAHIVAATVAAAWMLSIALPCLRVAGTPDVHSVYPVYVLAGRCWAAGDHVYLGTGYRYTPLVAALFSLFGQLPDRVGAPLWYLLNAGVYVAGLGIWLHRCAPASVRHAPTLFFLLVLPPSLASLNNGQANALVLGLMLLALTAVHEECWNTAAVCIGVAGAFKIYPLLLGAVLLALYPRRLIVRPPVVIAAAIVLPFLLHSPGYVLHEYQSWIQQLRADDRQLLPLALAYRDVRLLLRVSGMPIERSAYLCLQMAAAAALIVMFARRRASAADSLPLALALSTLWMTVLGPSTEACTYILLAPSLAQLMICTWHEEEHPWLKVALATAYFLMTYSQIPLRLPGAGTLGIHAGQCVGGLLLASVLARRTFVRQRSFPNGRHPARSA